jgi:hypothetical protein
VKTLLANTPRMATTNTSEGVLTLDITAILRNSYSSWQSTAQPGCTKPHIKLGTNTRVSYKQQKTKFAGMPRLFSTKLFYNPQSATGIQVISAYVNNRRDMAVLGKHA